MRKTVPSVLEVVIIAEASNCRQTIGIADTHITPRRRGKRRCKVDLKSKRRQSQEVQKVLIISEARIVGYSDETSCKVMQSEDPKETSDDEFKEEERATTDDQKRRCFISSLRTTICGDERLKC